MPNPTQALLAFGHLVAFLNDKDAVQFAWLGDPLNRSLKEMPENRAELHELLQALIHDGPTGQQPAFPLEGMDWEPVNPGSAVGVGFAWNTDTTEALRLGLGAAASLGPVDLAVLARLIGIEGGQLTVEAPSVKFGGNIPVPDFLQSASIDGEVSNDEDPSVSLAVNDATSARTLAIPGPPNSEKMKRIPAALARTS